MTRFNLRQLTEIKRLIAFNFLLKNYQNILYDYVIIDNADSRDLWAEFLETNRKSRSPTLHI